MNALLILVEVAGLVGLGIGLYACLWHATRPVDDEDPLVAEWDELATGPGPFIVADGPRQDDSWIEDAVLNHPAVEASYDDHVARAMAIIEWPTHPAHRAEFSDGHLAELLDTWGGEVR